ncbi:MAG: glycosyltransferase, partial [Thermodesulfobacteriota bacterium]|nr:glycosyltransferase [Thermodesulfobacteriota bacterium]
FRTQNSEPVLLFTGAMDYQANVDGVTWFCNEIFPMIKKEFPECQFFIVGSNPLPKVKELVNRDGVRVTGFVEDIRPFYQMADVCVISLRLARGVQNKVLEAMAMGKAVVTTTKSNEGIHAIPEQHLIVKNTPNGFADAVNRLLRGHAERDKIGAEAREFVIGKYDWSINMKKFDSIIRKS